MKKDDCIFCKIANGDIPSRTLHETEDFRVILDIAPVTKGHALIIPKNHYQDVFDLPEEIAGKAMVLAKEMATKIKENLAADGLNMAQNNGEVADQTVLHYHLHVIPRYKNEESIFSWDHKEVSAEELDEIHAKIVGR